MLMLIDAFADAPFTGNPAAVCLLTHEVETAWMHNLAAELNQSETAFVHPRIDGDWDLRWFTPTLEADLCGHATLATAHGLWQTATAITPAIRFHTRSGVLTCTRRQADICMDFPAVSVNATMPPEDIEAAVGARVIGAYRAGPDLLIEVDDAATVRALQPDLALIATLPMRGVIVTAVSDDPRWHFVSRFFAPQSGIPEDPVTGSAHCALGPFWGKRLRLRDLRGYQCSHRGGTVGVTVLSDRVELSGRARTVFHGALA